jgi:signal transduction histidine kinase
LRLTGPSVPEREHVLHIRVVALDPHGYEFATTAAAFDLRLTPAGQVVPVNFPNAPRAVVTPLHGQQDEDPGRSGTSSGSIVEAVGPVAEDGVTAADQRAASARAGWLAEEAARSARALELWRSAEAERWAAREREMSMQHARALAEAESRWRAREAERLAAAESQWRARLVGKVSRLKAAMADVPKRRISAGFAHELQHELDELLRAGGLSADAPRPVSPVQSGNPARRDWSLYVTRRGSGRGSRIAATMLRIAVATVAGLAILLVH